MSLTEVFVAIKRACGRMLTGVYPEFATHHVSSFVSVTVIEFRDTYNFKGVSLCGLLLRAGLGWSFFLKPDI